MNTDSIYKETHRALPAIHREAALSLNANRARALALDCGFTEAGLVPLPHAASERDAARFESWIQAGRAGTMQYLQRTSDDGRLVRSRSAIPFPWAQSAIVCMANYNTA